MGAGRPRAVPRSRRKRLFRPRSVSLGAAGPGGLRGAALPGRGGSLVAGRGRPGLAPPPRPGSAQGPRRNPLSATRTAASAPSSARPAPSRPTAHTQAGSGGRRRNSRAPLSPSASPTRSAERRARHAPSPRPAAAPGGPGLTSGCRMGTQPASFSYSSSGAAILVRAARPLHAGYCARAAPRAPGGGWGEEAGPRGDGAALRCAGMRGGSTAVSLPASAVPSGLLLSVRRQGWPVAFSSWFFFFFPIFWNKYSSAGLMATVRVCGARDSHSLQCFSHLTPTRALLCPTACPNVAVLTACSTTLCSGLATCTSAHRAPKDAPTQSLKSLSDQTGSKQPLHWPNLPEGSKPAWRWRTPVCCPLGCLP